MFSNLINLWTFRRNKFLNCYRNLFLGYDVFNCIDLLFIFIIYFIYNAFHKIDIEIKARGNKNIIKYMKKLLFILTLFKLSMSTNDIKAEK